MGTRNLYQDTMNPTKTLLSSIGYPDESGQFYDNDPVEDRDLYKLARKNKVGSLYLKTLHDCGELDELTEEWKIMLEKKEQMKKTLENLQKNLQNINYAIVKTGYPFWFDAADVDVVFFGEYSADQVHSELEAAGYDLLPSTHEFSLFDSVKLTNPHSIDARDPNTDLRLDVHVTFSLQHVIYFDGKSLNPDVTDWKTYGVNVPTVSRSDDLSLMTVHSMAEQMFILKEFYFALYALQTFSDRDLENFLSSIRENRLGYVCQTFMSLVKELANSVFSTYPTQVDTILSEVGHNSNEANRFRSHEYQTPHKYAKSTALRSIISKARSPVFTISLLKQTPRFINPFNLYYIFRMLHRYRTRDHDVPDPSDFESPQDT